MGALLEVKDLEVNFHTETGIIRAVRGVSFRLEPGETLAIVGESGCGKSVLCKSIAGILHQRGRVDGGEILLHGTNLAALPRREMDKIRGRKIGMVFQDPMTSLDPTYPIGEQIAEAVRVGRGAPKRTAKALALELMELVGIDSPAERYRQYPSQFSGGMRQRAVIAIALAGEPELLIADEPTTALDVTIQAQVLEVFRRVQEKTGVGILFITHDLGVVARIASRVAVMYAGKIVETGTVREVLHDPRHPYTWGLLSSLPIAEYSAPIPGSPPDLSRPIRGDAFAPRNPCALEIDFEEEPPMFRVDGTHFAATWLLHPDAPKIEPPVRMEHGKIVRGAP